MKIVRAEPPLMDGIHAVFGVRGQPVIFAFGDTIYCPPPHSAFIEPALIEHEEVHGARQLEFLGGVLGWWKHYMADPVFRLAEEIPAHRAEYQWYVRNAARGSRERAAVAISHRLSGPLYGNLIDFDEARLLVSVQESVKPDSVVRHLEARMSAVKLKEVFNAVSQPRFTCAQATMHYERGDTGTEWQVLTFSGIGAGGSPFEVKSPRLGPNTDLLEAARATAQALLEEG